MIAHVIASVIVLATGIGIASGLARIGRRSANSSAAGRSDTRETTSRVRMEPLPRSRVSRRATARRMPLHPLRVRHRRPPRRLLRTLLPRRGIGLALATRLVQRVVPRLRRHLVRRGRVGSAVAAAVAVAATRAVIAAAPQRTTRRHRHRGTTIDTESASVTRVIRTASASETATVIVIARRIMTRTATVIVTERG